MWEDRRPATILSPQAFENAIIADMALCGSTNAIVHLIALARRAGIPLSIDDFDRISREVPVIANLRPAGEYLMEDFHDAGGVPALLSRLAAKLHLDATTVTGRSLGENIAGAEVLSDEVIRPLDRPLDSAGGTFVLRGNLAPDGCVIKPTAADPRLLVHSGPALVFDSYADLKARIDSPDLDVTPDTILVLRNAGPIGGSGNARVGDAADPEKAPRGGRPRHGADLRRADVGDELRHLRAPCRSRISRRRRARAGADRRPDRPRRPRQARAPRRR